MASKSQPTVLSIAGSDNTGGAGIQADIKTCCAFKTYASTVITGVTSQNCNGVFGVEAVSLSLIASQIDSIYEVMNPGAVKTGMLPSPEIIELVAEKVKQYQMCNLVVDPVMVATNGGNLVNPGSDTLSAFNNHLLPLAKLITPNLSEASVLAGCNLRLVKPLEACRRILDATHAKAILLKGGHSENAMQANDYLYDGHELVEFPSPRINTVNTHGTGCTLSAAIACGLAQEMTLVESVRKAKEFIQMAIESAKDLKISNGPGPLDFFVQ